MEQFGFLNINKPKGMTSHDVVYVLRKKLGIKQIGHSGTLDPLATGVLVVGVGKATRLFEFLKEEKVYTATMKFGYDSETLDTESELVKIDDFCPQKEELEEVLHSFVGDIEQIPPKYSAVKVQGKKLYEMARKGQEIKVIPSRKIVITDIKLKSLDANVAVIEVACSKGTYVRSLIRDIAEKLGTKAVMTDLIRSKSGIFNVENSVELNENLQKEEIENKMINPLDVLEYNKLEINEAELTKIKNGVAIENKGFNENEIILTVFDEKLISIGRILGTKIIQKKVLI